MFFETVKSARLDRGFTTTWSKNTDYAHGLFYKTCSRRPDKLLIKDLEQITKKHNTSAIINLIKLCAFEYTGFFQQRKQQLLVFVLSSLKNNTIPVQGNEIKFQAGSARNASSIQGAKTKHVNCWQQCENAMMEHLKVKSTFFSYCFRFKHPKDGFTVKSWSQKENQPLSALFW